MKTRIAFIIVHFVLVAGTVVMLVFGAYTEEAGHAEYRRWFLHDIYNEVKLYKQDTGSYPATLDSLLSFDLERYEVYFGSKELKGRLRFVLEDMQGNGINKYIHYDVVQEEPVITDLGMDGKQRGTDMDMDITYPPKYQKPFPFRDFIKTKQFARSLCYGLPLGGVVSICLLAMWGKRYPTGEIPPSVIYLSVLFVLFELFLIHTIIFAEIYPHH